MQVQHHIDINAPIDKVWHLVAIKFDRVEDWVSGVAISKKNVAVKAIKGAEMGGRVCTAPGFGDIQETFLTYDEANKRFSYKATGLPFFMTSVINNWSLEELGANKTRVTMRLDIELNAFPGFFMRPMMNWQFNKVIRETLEEAKHYLETGQVHPRKLKAQQKFQKVHAA